MGGGIVGWMMVCYLVRIVELMVNNSNVFVCVFKIMFFEFVVISIVGVGEGLMFYLCYFFEFLGINENEWMLWCSVIYKMGISFECWIVMVELKIMCFLFIDLDSYFYLFFFFLDIFIVDMYFNVVNEYRKGVLYDINLLYYFIVVYMVEKGIMFDVICSFVNIDYVYYFDVGLLGDFLKEYVLNKGVFY